MPRVLKKQQGGKCGWSGVSKGRAAGNHVRCIIWGEKWQKVDRGKTNYIRKCKVCSNLYVCASKL